MYRFLFITLALGLTQVHAGDDPLSSIIDLGGVVLQHGKNASRGSGDDLLQASPSYDYLISGTVTGEGAFSFIDPGTDLRQALDMFDPGFSENLDGTVINPSGKLPFIVVSRKLKGNFDVGPFTAQAKATVKAGVRGSGEAFFSLTGVSFTFAGAPVNGKITFDPGSSCNILVPPASNLPKQPDVLIGLNGQEALGNNVYLNQTITVTVSKGHAVKVNVLLQNDGTTTDSLTLQGPAGNDDIQLTYLEGKTDVTDAVVAGTYTVDNIESRGGAVLKAKVKVKRAGATVDGDLILRSAVPGITDTTRFVIEGS
jgi:hypothetical protein